jgi:hypothetical protein
MPILLSFPGFAAAPSLIGSRLSAIPAFGDRAVAQRIARNVGCVDDIVRHGPGASDSHAATAQDHLIGRASAFWRRACCARFIATATAKGSQQQGRERQDSS